MFSYILGNERGQSIRKGDNGGFMCLSIRRSILMTIGADNDQVVPNDPTHRNDEADYRVSDESDY
jgi:hypothetical protein